MAYPKHRGTVKQYSIEKKWGFILPESNGGKTKDLFFGKENVKDGTDLEQLTQGVPVLFHTQIVNERKRATKIELLL